MCEDVYYISVVAFLVLAGIHVQIYHRFFVHLKCITKYCYVIICDTVILCLNIFSCILYPCLKYVCWSIAIHS